MALIKCPECGKEISDKSITCIGCGYPLKNEKNNQETSILFDGFTGSPIINETNNANSSNKTDVKCPKCGNPSSLTPKGRVRLCKKCAEEKKQNAQNLKEEITTEDSSISNLSNTTEDDSASNLSITTEDSDSSNLPKTSSHKFLGDDHTKSNTIKRFILQFISSIICAGVAFVLGGLIVYIIQELLAGLRLNLLAITMVAMAVTSVLAGISLGLAGPITLSNGAYVKKENHAFIIKAKAKPIKVLSLTIFSLITIAGIVLLVLAFILYKEKIDPYTDNENTLMPIIIPFIIAVYYFTLTISTLININQSTCPHCGHIDSKYPVGKSNVKTEEKTQEKEVTYSGSSYDVVDSSGNTIGSIRGPSSTVKKHRTITNKSWTVYTKCKICGKHSNAKESSTEKTKWQ